MKQREEWSACEGDCRGSWIQAEADADEVQVMAVRSPMGSVGTVAQGQGGALCGGMGPECGTTPGTS